MHFTFGRCCVVHSYFDLICLFCTSYLSLSSEEGHHVGAGALRLRCPLFGELQKPPGREQGGSRGWGSAVLAT